VIALLGAELMKDFSGLGVTERRIARPWLGFATGSGCEGGVWGGFTESLWLEDETGTGIMDFGALSVETGVPPCTAYRSRRG
jgi:hypothetical protein